MNGNIYLIFALTTFVRLSICASAAQDKLNIAKKFLRICNNKVQQRNHCVVYNFVSIFVDIRILM